MNMKDKIEHARNLVLFDKWHQNKGYVQRDNTEAIIAALPSMVVPLVWDGFRSGHYEINVYLDMPASLLFYTSNEYEDDGPEHLYGGWLTLVSIDDLKAKAQSHHVTQIMAAFGVVA